MPIATRSLLSCCLLLTSLGAMAVEVPGCPPSAPSINAIRQLKATDWRLADADQPQSLAMALLPCLSHPDPDIRDGIAFEGLSALLRGKHLSIDTQTRIYRDQLAQLQSPGPDPEGFAKPFAALVLAEVARSDRLKAFLNVEQREAMVTAATSYVSSISDYRGFTTGEGWRHGVAHGADLLMQLALNPAVDAAQLEHIVQAVETQVDPKVTHFYIYGEGERLARPVLFAVRRGLLREMALSHFIDALASPTPLASWGDAFQSQRGLARLHNVKAFLRALATSPQGTPDLASQDAVLAKLVTAALARLP